MRDVCPHCMVVRHGWPEKPHRCNPRRLRSLAAGVTPGVSHTRKPERPARPTPGDERYEIPTAAVLARYELLSDLRTPEALDLAEEIGFRIEEHPLKRLDGGRYVYTRAGLGEFTKSARRFHGHFPRVRKASKDMPHFLNKVGA